MWLLIDDVRDLGCGVIVRTPEAAKAVLGVGSHLFECVCFDHDLGSKETGYDVLKWAIESRVLPSRVQLVTSDPVGRQNMANLLNVAGYVSRDGTNFSREVGLCDENDLRRW